MQILVGVTLNSLTQNGHRQVFSEDAETFCRDNRIDYFTEANAMELNDIDGLFETVERALVSRVDSRVPLDGLREPEQGD